MKNDIYGPGDDDYGRRPLFPTPEQHAKEIAEFMSNIKPWEGVVKPNNKMVRAKFICNVNKDNGSTDENYKGSEIHLSAVYSGSPENEAFFKMTPGGNISLVTVNPNAAEKFIPGKEYYVDFTPCD